MNKLISALPALALVVSCSGNSGNQAGSTSSSGAQVTGAGSTFVYPVLSAWAADYKSQGGATINYQSIGSGGGIAQVKAGTVDFGATDQPLASDDLAKSSLAQFPIVVGGIVPVVNIPGIDPGKLKLTGPVLADIYAGKVKNWNDPAIAKINPGLTLPGAAISVVHRSDGSGTTFNFTHYLAQVSPTWKSGPGEGKTVNWPAGVGGKGNEGVAAYVKQLPNSLGYVEYAYVMQSHMAYALLQNSAGNFVAPSAGAFAAAAATVDWAHAKDFNLVMTNARALRLTRSRQARSSSCLSNPRTKASPKRPSLSSNMRWKRARVRRTSSITSRFPRLWSSRSRATSAPTSSEHNARPQI